MSIQEGNRTYYRTSEACQIAGISRATLFRWFKAGIIHDAMDKDQNGWRLFSDGDVGMMKSVAERGSQR